MRNRAGDGVRFRSRSFRIVGAAALALALAACSGPVGETISGAGRSLGDMLSLSSEDTEPVATGEGAARPGREGARFCPPIVVREGTETLRRYVAGNEGDPQAVVHQGALIKTARECRYAGDEVVTIRFGVSGRVVLGPAGAPGTVELPIRAAFVAPGEPPVWTNFYRLPVTVLPGETVADFAQVEENLTYTITPEGPITNFIIYVGFDELGDRRS